ncbi:MAG TPA: acyl-CoA desaturase [Solirubrobacterales bacterium]|nr:acyl-CoA desaturase [Solirubrobacterales bacterium]
MSTATVNPPQAAEENPLARLSPEQLDAIGQELDAIRDRIMADLGDRDRRYIESMIAMHRRLAILGRVLLLVSRRRSARLAGTAALSAAKILENMEIGHNVMHGQWDWMNDPRIHSTTWDWDNVSPADAWKHSHNYEHHTFTNVRGKDRDLGYEIMRIDPEQRWHPVYLLQPVYNLILAAFFEWGVAVHDLNFEAIESGEKSKRKLREELRAIGGKVKAQVLKDYVAWPLLSGLAQGILGRSTRRGLEGFGQTAKADATANVIRNAWAYAIIFCGHFPDQTYTFSEEEVEGETRGGWYVRQLLGSANIEGSPLFHVASGNLGYQVEHHLFPDMPSSRYAEVAPQVKDVCERYELPYNAGPFGRQLGMVQRTILRLAFPGGRRRPKPGPYQSEEA